MLIALLLLLLIVSAIVAVIVVVNNQKLKVHLRKLENERVISDAEQERLKNYYSQWVLALIANTHEYYPKHSSASKIATGVDKPITDPRPYATIEPGAGVNINWTVYGESIYEALGGLLMPLTREWVDVVVMEERGKMWIVYFAGQGAKFLSETGYSRKEALGKLVYKYQRLLNLEIKEPSE